MNFNRYQCLSCGEIFAEEPDEPVCPICYADAIVSEDYAERMSNDWSDDD